MSEPTVSIGSVGWVAVATATLGPIRGESAIVLIGATVGSLIALEAHKSTGFLDGLWFVMRATSVGTVFGSLAAWVLAQRLGLTESAWLLPAPCAVAMFWHALRDRVVAFIRGASPTVDGVEK